MSDADTFKDDDALAAEYVLGVLEAPLRAELAQRVAKDPDFAARVAQWEARFESFNETYEQVAPPKSVKNQLDKRLFSSQSRTGLWHRVGVWRGVAGLLSAAVVALIFVLFTPNGAPTYVAALSVDGGPERFVVQYDVAKAQLVALQTEGPGPVNQVYELWLVPEDGVPQSLGVLGKDSVRVPAFSKEQRGKVASGLVLAISREAPGGSAPGAGPAEVVAVGRFEQI